MTSDMVELYRSHGVPEAEIRAEEQRRQTEMGVGTAAMAESSALTLHPYNLIAYQALDLVAGCFVLGTYGGIVGFRFADADAALNWHDIDKPVRQQLTTAINAILEG